MRGRYETKIENRDFHLGSAMLLLRSVYRQIQNRTRGPGWKDEFNGLREWISFKKVFWFPVVTDVAFSGVAAATCCLSF